MTFTDHKAELQSIVGVDHCLDSEDDLFEYGKDWTNIHKPDPQLILLPRELKQIQQVHSYCNKHSIPITPSGGRTGLSGGAVATKKSVVLNLSRYNKIIAVDRVSMTIEAQAGAITQNLQDAAAKEGLLYPLDLAAKGSCQLGGNIATNAGGLKFIRYGGMRDHVLGLQVVLSSGEVLEQNRQLYKDNCGYDLKQLFVGSEGTLGTITQATIKLVQQPKKVQLALATTKDFALICSVLEECNQRNVVLSAFEFFTHEAHTIVAKQFPQNRKLFEEAANFYLLLEAEADEEEFAELFAVLLEKGLVDDAVLAQNSSEFHELWQQRELISEAVAMNGHVYKNDVAVPVVKLPDFYSCLQAEVMQTSTRIQLVLFGHVGDGNIHLNYVAPKESIGSENFLDEVKQTESRVMKILGGFKGSVSAEHGIGLLKKDLLNISRTELEVGFMRKIKQLFDPSNIMNPGKIF